MWRKPSAPRPTPTFPCRWDARRLPSAAADRVAGLTRCTNGSNVRDGISGSSEFCSLYLHWRELANETEDSCLHILRSDGSCCAGDFHASRSTNRSCESKGGGHL